MTLPSEPGLSTRTGDASFEGLSWAASDAAKAACPVPAAWFACWMAVPPHPQPPACDCDAPWVVAARLPAFADEAALFDCVTEPPSPGLKTRIETLLFDGLTWFAAESAAAVWSVDACWSDVCTGVEPLQPHDEPAWLLRA